MIINIVMMNTVINLVIVNTVIMNVIVNTVIIFVIINILYITIDITPRTRVLVGGHWLPRQLSGLQVEAYGLCLGGFGLRVWVSHTDVRV